jgi:hypothetical protein
MEEMKPCYIALAGGLTYHVIDTFVEPKFQYLLGANILLFFLFKAAVLFLKRLYHKEDNNLLIFRIFSRGLSSNISQKYKSGKF